MDDFRTSQKKFVDCMDMMGQDREITDEQKTFVLTTIKRFIEIWELEERVALKDDRDRRLEALDTDAETIAQNDAIMAQEVA